MLKEKLQKLIKSNLLLQSQQKERILLSLESASESELNALGLILESSDQKLMAVLEKNLNAESAKELVFKFKKIKKEVDKMQEGAELERDKLIQEDLLSKINKL